MTGCRESEMCKKLVLTIIPVERQLGSGLRRPSLSSTCRGTVSAKSALLLQLPSSLGRVPALGDVALCLRCVRWVPLPWVTGTPPPQNEPFMAMVSTPTCPSVMERHVFTGWGTTGWGTTGGGGATVAGICTATSAGCVGALAIPLDGRGSLGAGGRGSRGVGCSAVIPPLPWWVCTAGGGDWWWVWPCRGISCDRGSSPPLSLSRTRKEGPPAPSLPLATPVRQLSSFMQALSSSAASLTPRPLSWPAPAAQALMPS